MYAFGHGLSYVDFAYGNIAANKSSYGPKDVIKVSFSLTNKGGMEADEVAQLYVHRVNPTVEWPAKELKAFSRVALAAGETKTVTLEIPVADLRYYDVATSSWQLEAGDLEIYVGSASDDLRLTTTCTIKK